MHARDRAVLMHMTLRVDEFSIELWWIRWRNLWQELLYKVIFHLLYSLSIGKNVLFVLNTIFH